VNKQVIDIRTASNWSSNFCRSNKLSNCAKYRCRRPLWLAGHGTASVSLAASAAADAAAESRCINHIGQVRALSLPAKHRSACTGAAHSRLSVHEWRRERPMWDYCSIGTVRPQISPISRFRPFPVA